VHDDKAEGPNRTAEGPNDKAEGGDDKAEMPNRRAEVATRRVERVETIDYLSSATCSPKTRSMPERSVSPTSTRQVSENVSTASAPSGKPM